MLYGSWPEEHPADQIRTVVPGDSLSQRRDLLGHEREMRRLAEERGVVDRAQVDQQLRAPARRIELEHLLVELRKAVETLGLEARAQAGLQQPHAVGFERDPDLIAQEGHDRQQSPSQTRLRVPPAGVAACPMLPRYTPSPFNDPRVEKTRSTSNTSKKPSW